jgi:cardiolipin synthase
MLKNKEPGFVIVEEARWLTGGIGYFSLMEQMITEAVSSITLFVYILTPDDTGNRILGLLKDAARRNVKVNLLVDDFGSDEIDAKREEDLQQAGIHFTRFEPVFSTSNVYVGRRMHTKVLIADGIKALVGGINIANRYKGSETSPAWLDFAVYVRGHLAATIERSCFNMLRPLQSVKVPRLIASSKQQPFDLTKLNAIALVNDFLRNRKEIARSYNRAVRSAEKTITIVGGYFLPGRKFRRLLRQAVSNGVQVQVIMTKISDVPVTRLASEYLYGRLLRSGIRIFEYRHSMVHGKVAVVDGTWATIGSYNQNHLSAYLSIELNIDVVNSEFAGSLETYLHQLILNDCDEIILDTHAVKARPLTKLKRWVAYRLVQVSLRFLFLVNRVVGVDD